MMETHPVDGGRTARIILRGCSAGLSDVGFNELMIRMLCDHLGMTPIGQPFTQEIPPGISTGLIIAESHLFIHTWPESCSVRVVIDSCADFDHEAAGAWLAARFSASVCEVHVT
jgi:S-adenosylmethionine/arginine decarboxylase-like enzyme